MGFFTGVSGVARSRTNSRGKFFKDGKYLVEINKLQAFNKRDTGQPMAIVEGYIVEVLNEVPNTSNTEGEKVSWFNSLSRKPDGDLTQEGQRGMSRIKAFIAELLGGDSEGVKDNDITEEVCEQLFGALEGFTGEETKGVRLIAEARTTVSTTSNKPFTNVYWSAVTE
tara:strand:- start:338 stop:841 length:504 start_codon:yes stop_codon:yes gene_type:complete